MTNSANLGLPFFHVRYTKPDNGGPYECEWYYRLPTDKIDLALGSIPRHWVLLSVQVATILYGGDWLREENLMREGEQADLLLGFTSLHDRNQYFHALGRQAMDVAVHGWMSRCHRLDKEVAARFYFHELNTNGIVVTDTNVFDGEPTARLQGDGPDFSAFFCSNSDLWGLHKSAEGRLVPLRVASQSPRCAGVGIKKEEPIPVTELARKMGQDLDSALRRVSEKGRLTPALKSHDVITKDVIIGFDIVKRRTSSVFKKDQGENWPVRRAPEPMMSQHLELYVERQARMPTLRRSHINLLTTKGKGYGPLFFIEEGLEADLCDALTSLYKESKDTLPLLVTTVIKTSPEAKPVSTPLGRLHEATAMRVMPDLSHTAMFYDFGVLRADLVQPDGE